jgi:DNA-binding GntR family transcriptional regulator
VPLLPAISDPADSGALLVDRVAQRLRAAILDGSISPGQRLRQDQIARELGVSKIPVREALQLLQAEGLILLLPHAGARVPRLDPSELIEIYQIRERLEPLAITLSVPLLPREVFSQLREQMEVIEVAAAKADIGQWVDADRRFHLLALSAAPPRLLHMIEPLWNVSQHYRRTYLILPDRFATAALDHELLMRAIESRSPEDAELLCLLHIRRTRLALTEHARSLGWDGDARQASGDSARQRFGWMDHETARSTG